MTIIKKQTILGTIYAYLGVIVGTITQALIIPNFLTIEENGLLAMLSSWMFILVFTTNLGFTSAGTRFFDKFRDKSTNHKGFLFNGLIFLFIGFSLTILILVVFKNNILSSSVGDNSLFKKYYYYILPITLFTASFNIFDTYAKGLYDTIRGNFLSQFLLRLLVLCSILLYISQLIKFDLFISIWALAISVPAILMIIHAISLGDFSLKPKPFLWKSSFKKDFISFAGFSIVTGLSSIVITRLDTLMVYEYLGLGQTGIYNTCLFFGSVMTMSYNINIKASSAIVINALEENDIQKVKQIFTKSSITQMLFGTLLLSVVWVNIDTLFSFIKPEYAAGKYVLLIIGLAKLYDLSSGINSLILGYSKHYRFDSALVITFVGLLFLLNHFLIPKYGLNGAAIAALFATIYYNSARNIIIWKFFRIHPYTSKLGVILIIGISLTYLGTYLPDLNIGKLSAFLDLCYKSAIITTVYVAIIYFLKLSEDVNDVIKSVVRKILFLS
jgi:O-antigen/teichoic acid export membrane protein